jgi:hypothetical protein
MSKFVEFISTAATRTRGRRLSALASALVVAGVSVGPVLADQPVVVTDGTLNLRLPPSSDAGTLTEGGQGITCSQGTAILRGYATSGTAPNPPWGSYSPSTLTGGKTVGAVYDWKGGPCGSLGGYVYIKGFTSNPGSTWMTSIKCTSNNVTLDTSSATYSYTSGTAKWYWSGSNVFGFPTTTGGKYTCTIVHS